MFSFHKPKIYRSLKGCCICRAKSSSSRFTDSKRYELDFDKCFRISEKRSGEICNACVLLVKRWKKLPVGSTRNWHHVVDARAGPGTKSIAKIKNKAKEEKLLMKRKHKHRKVSKLSKPPQSPGALSDDVLIGEDCLSESEEGSNYSRAYSEGSDVSDDDQEVPRARPAHASSSRRRKRANPSRISSFLDLNYWKKTKVCCGIIFKGPNGEVLLDPQLLRPCRSCKPSPSSSASQSPAYETALSDPTTPLPASQSSSSSSSIIPEDDEEEEEEMMEGGVDQRSSFYPTDTLDEDSRASYLSEEDLYEDTSSDVQCSQGIPQFGTSTAEALDLSVGSARGVKEIERDSVSPSFINTPTTCIPALHCLEMEV